jgi:protein arginine N-methyltransferase 1
MSGSIYSINAYGDMIADCVRRDAYTAALVKVVRPGDLVLDLGTGTGFFAFIACRLGARVVAVEPEPVIQVAKEIAAANGLAGRIEFIQDRCDRVSLPERADVLVSDLRGKLPMLGRHLPSIADARGRLLKPGGVQIPASDELWAAVVEVPERYGYFAKAWIDNESGLDMSAARRLAVNASQRIRLTTEQLMAAPARWATLDYTRLEDADVDGSVQFTVDRAGHAHGIALWFDSILTEGVALSNAPSRPELVYGNVFLPLESAVAVEAGDTVSAILSARLVNDDYVWRWEVSVDRGGRSLWRSRQSTFFDSPLSIATLRKRSDAHTPRLNEEGEVVSFVLERMRGGATLGEIAREAAERFPHRFASVTDALSTLGDLATRYSE